VGSTLAVALATRASRRHLDIDLETAASPVRPLADALLSALSAIPGSAVADPFGVGILWHASWLHLLVDMRTVEWANGREGEDQRSVGLDSLRAWHASRRARRAVLHAVDVHSRAREKPLGCEGLSLPSAPSVLFCAFD
jgi:hypothetical protein